MDDFYDGPESLDAKAWALLNEHGTAIVNALRVYDENMRKVADEHGHTYPGADKALRAEAAKAVKIADAIQDLMGDD